MGHKWSRRAFVALLAPSVLGACAPGPVRQTVVPSPATAVRATLPAVPTPPAPTATTVAVPTAASPNASPTTALVTPPPTPVPATPTVAVRPTPTLAIAPSGADASTLLVRHRAPEIAAGTLEALRRDGDQLVLEQHGSGYADVGRVTSAEIPAVFPFDTLVPSWNALAAAGTQIQVELRVRQAGAWSGWYSLGRWGTDQRGSVAGQKDDAGEVDVDTLRLARPAEAFQYRVTLTTRDPQSTTALRLVAVNYADLRRPLTGPPVQPPAGWARDLPVPPQSQLLQDPKLAWDVCSPTSLTMALQFWGARLQVPDAIRGVRDATANIYGNWPFNTAFAATQGLEAVVDRFTSIEHLQGAIAAGRPVVVSVRFKAGELAGAPVASTSGHLFVVRGFTAAGDVIVNDPLGPTLPEVRRIYRRDQLANVWLGHGGVAYVMGPPAA